MSNNLNPPIVLSLKPKWADEILTGKKTIEIRRRFMRPGIKNVRALIYATASLKSLVGEVTIKEARRVPIEDIWSLYGPQTMVDRKLLDEYLGDLGEGALLFLSDPVVYPTSITLSELRERHGFTSPQSYAYAKQSLLEEVANLKNVT